MLWKAPLILVQLGLFACVGTKQDFAEDQVNGRFRISAAQRYCQPAQ
jgi:hypothetical protein